MPGYDDVEQSKLSKPILSTIPFNPNKSLLKQTKRDEYFERIRQKVAKQQVQKQLEISNDESMEKKAEMEVEEFEGDEEVENAVIGEEEIELKIDDSVESK